MSKVKECDLIKDREKKTEMRKAKKAIYDSSISLSVADNESDYTIEVKLLDEGMVTFSDGSPYFYIAKGTLDRYLNGGNKRLGIDNGGMELLNLTDDHIGSVNLGHMTFASFPFLLGTWSKEDLSLVDNGDERKGLNVKLHLDKDSVFIKELKRMNYTLSVSAEFVGSVNSEMSKEVGVPVYDEIYIHDLAIVGDGGNVGSNGITLSADNTIKSFTTMKKGVDQMEDNKVEVIEEKIDNEENLSTENEVETETEVKAEVETEKANKNDIILEAITALKDEVLTLKDEIQSLKVENGKMREQNEELSQKLSVKEEEEKDFMEKFKTLSIELAPNEVKKKTVSTACHIGTDGIGEF